MSSVISSPGSSSSILLNGRTVGRAVAGDADRLALAGEGGAVALPPGFLVIGGGVVAGAPSAATPCPCLRRSRSPRRPIAGILILPMPPGPTSTRSANRSARTATRSSRLVRPGSGFEGRAASGNARSSSFSSSSALFCLIARVEVRERLFPGEGQARRRAAITRPAVMSAVAMMRRTRFTSTPNDREGPLRSVDGVRS